MPKGLIIFVILIILLVTSVQSVPPIDETTTTYEKSYDYSNYIFENFLFMFVTNTGILGRDLSGVFGYSYGTWYPAYSINDIKNNINGAGSKSPLYSAGIWLGGKVNDKIRVSSAEYSTEYVPGPMENYTYMPDQPEFRVYKLYSDSLETNPNSDYQNWPVEQGAPITADGKPKMNGDQMLWSVFNDADASHHRNFGSVPLGVEIQQTVYAKKEDQPYIIYEPARTLETRHIGNGNYQVFVDLAQANDFTGHDYLIELDKNEKGQLVWHIKDITTGKYCLKDQNISIGFGEGPIVDGYCIYIYPDFDTLFKSIEVISNSAGVLFSPEPGALGSAGFPTPNNADPSENQQISNSRWALHTYDNGKNGSEGTYGTYSYFNSRSCYWNSIEIKGTIFNYDYEIRFTGTNENPGIGGSMATNYKNRYSPAWVPFELWCIGKNTPDDTSDDFRMIPLVYMEEGNSIFDLNGYGSYIDENCAPGGCEHTGHPETNDPMTDQFTFLLPIDEEGHIITIPGDSMYYAFEELMHTDPSSYIRSLEQYAITYLTLINIDGGSEPPFEDQTPEMGTVFRLKTNDLPSTDKFTFTQSLDAKTVTPEAKTVTYIKYKIKNKGGNIIEDMYFSYWVDADIGSSTDDKAGCDTLNNIFFAYNASSYDYQYGSQIPILGYKILYGPVIHQIDSKAVFDGVLLNNYKNIGMSSFFKYINGTDPVDPQAVYDYMRGINGSTGQPYYYQGEPLNYMHSGDIYDRIGDLDPGSADIRMMSSCGPFTMNPGDSQFVLIKMATTFKNYNYLRDILNNEILDFEQPKLTYLTPNPIFDVGTDFTGFYINFFTNEFPAPYKLKDVDFSALSISNSITPLSSSIAAPSEKINEEHLRIEIAGAELVSLFPSDQRKFTGTYTINGKFNDGVTFEIPGIFNFFDFIPGDLNVDNQVDISDLVYFVDYSFRDGAAPKVTSTADLNEDGLIDIEDLSLMVNMIFPRN